MKEETRDLEDVWAESKVTSSVKAPVREEDLSIDDRWDEASLAALVGYNEGTKAPLSNSSVLPELEISSEMSANVIEQSELFDDPVTHKSKPSFASNPYVKALGAGIPLLAIFGFAGLFMSGVTGEKKDKTAPAVAKTPTPQPSVAIANVQPEETGNLKTQVALGKQAEQMKAIDEAKKPKIEVKTQRPADKSASPHNVSPPSSFPPVSDYQPRRSQVFSPPPPLPAQSQPPAATPKQPTGEVKPIDSIKPIDSREQWMALAKLGSYGNVESGTARSLGNGGRERDRTPTEQTAASNVYTIPQAVPVLTASSQFATPMPQTARTAPGGIVSPLAAVANSASDSAEEVHLLNGIPIRTLQVGTATEGQLVSPLIWSEPAATSGTETKAMPPETTATPQEFVVQLMQPLSDHSGRTTLPTATQIICQVVSVERSGLVNLAAKRAVIEGQEYVLPSDAISIRGRDGKPLIASKYGNKGSSLLSADLQGVLFGALGKVGQVLTQPDSQASTSVSGSGFSSSTTSSQGGRNIFGAALDGAFSPLSQQIEQRTQQNMAAIRSLPELWYVGAGKDVQVFVNESFEF